MQLLTWTFALAGPMDALKDESGALVSYTAWERFANPQDLALNKSGRGPFVRLQPPGLPKVPGVYAVTNDDHVQYVGLAKVNLAARWGRGGYSVIDPRNCYVGGQSTNCHLNHLIGEVIGGGGSLSLWVLPSPDPRPIELTLIRALRPPWNLQDRD